MTILQKAYSVLTVKDFKQSADVVTVEGIASTPTTDRVGDIVEPLGARFKTPMPLMMHHNSTLPVGRVMFAKATKDGIPFKAELPIVVEPGVVQDRVNEAIHSLKYFLIACVSIGFSPVEGAIERLKSGGLLYKAWNWLELSLVVIPANPDAVISGFKSMDAAAKQQALIQQIKSADQAYLRASLGARPVVRLDMGSKPTPGASGKQSAKRLVYLNPEGNPNDHSRGANRRI